MQDRYENYVLADQLANLVKKLSARSGLREKLAEWFCEDGGQQLGVAVPEYDEDDERNSRRMRHLSRFGSNSWSRDKKPISSAAWREMCEAIGRTATRLKTQNKSRLQKNIDALASEVELDRVDTAIFALAVRVGSDDIYKGLCDSLFDSRKTSLAQLTSALLKMKPEDISSRLKHSSLLAKTGMIRMKLDAWNSDFFDFFTIPDQILRAIQPPNEGIGDIERAIFGVPCTADLAWCDFDHLGEQRQFIAELVQGAVREKARGINILFYGPPGTGKTEFCKTLTHHLNLKMHAVGEATEDGDEPSRKERIAALSLSDLLLARHQGTVLLFDEMEDLVDDNFISMLFPGPARPKSLSTGFLRQTRCPPCGPAMKSARLTRPCCAG